MISGLPVLAKKSLSPPGCTDDTASHVVSAIMLPPTAPLAIPMPVRRPQNMDSTIGMTAEPITTPMKRYSQPRLTCRVQMEMRTDDRVKINLTSNDIGWNDVIDNMD